jgi:glycosyltransferase involved in cell wall biosynthesis
MNSTHSEDLYNRLNLVLDGFKPTSWSEIAHILDEIKIFDKISQNRDKQNYLEHYSKGTAFITFDFGIDGVSIEISKYAHTLESIYQPFAETSVHMIAGNFHAKASSILSNNWSRFEIEGINGWNKWEDGKWFRALFEKRIKPNSQESKVLAAEIFSQAVSIAKRLGKYLIDNQVSLLIPVNIASNPGNMALTLGVVLLTEIMGIHVLNSNHDFYWESGKSSLEREPGEETGIRDHFFRNSKHKSFFALFQSLYPWNGKRWLQVNINNRQSRNLIKRFGFPKDKIYEISTCVDDKFFDPYSDEDIKHARLRMAYILSDGESRLRPVSIHHHLSRLDDWMKNQTPLILGACPGLSVDPESDDLIILLQPTRIIARKRIERNIDLIKALLKKSPLGKEFERNPARQLVLHITGPTPKEHQEDLERVLFSYKKLVEKLPENIARRIFVAFSVGQDDHPAFSKHQFSPLAIDDIYRMANAVVFPSETEGRGLPIIEASAIGIPIICSRYHPINVFRRVIGKGLPNELQIYYTLFPEGIFSPRYLLEVSNILLSSRENLKSIAHNKAAVQARYSLQALKEKFEFILTQIQSLD